MHLQQVQHTKQLDNGATTLLLSVVQMLLLMVSCVADLQLSILQLLVTVQLWMSKFVRLRQLV